MADEGEKRIWQGFSFGLGLLIPMAFAVMVGRRAGVLYPVLYMLPAIPTRNTPNGTRIILLMLR